MVGLGHEVTAPSLVYHDGQHFPAAVVILPSPPPPLEGVPTCSHFRLTHVPFLSAGPWYYNLTHCKLQLLFPPLSSFPSPTCADSPLPSLKGVPTSLTTIPTMLTHVLPPSPSQILPLAVFLVPLLASPSRQIGRRSQQPRSQLTRPLLLQQAQSHSVHQRMIAYLMWHDRPLRGRPGSRG